MLYSHESTHSRSFKKIFFSARASRLTFICTDSPSVRPGLITVKMDLP